MEALRKVLRINSPKKSTVYKWIQRFREGREDLEDDPRAGRPTTSRNAEKIDAVQHLIDEDRRIMISEIGLRVPAYFMWFCICSTI